MRKLVLIIRICDKVKYKPTCEVVEEELKVKTVKVSNDQQKVTG